MRSEVFKSKKSISLVSLTLLLTISALSTSQVSAALTCPVADQSFLDWDAPGIDWPPPVNGSGAPGDYTPTLDQAFVIDGVTFDFAISGDSGDANLIASFEERADAAEDSPIDSAATVGPGDVDGDGNNDPGLQVIVDSVDTAGNPLDLDVILDVAFSEPLSEFEFSVSDIDHSDPGASERQDVVTITGFYMGNTVLPTLTPEYIVTGPTDTGLTVSGNTATAQIVNQNVSPNGSGAIAPADPDRGTVIATFDQPVDAIRINYADGLEAGADLGGTRGISMINNFGFCPAPDISGTVFEDVDGDGVFSAGDTPISGVTVQIFADDGTGNPTGAALDTQVTNGTGDYTFADLDPSTNYVIVETDPAGFVSVTDINGDTTSPANNQIPVALGTTDVVDQDFLDIPSADISVTKTDGVGDYTPGSAFSYTIVATNGGPSAADGSNITDTLPTWAEGVTWTCGSPTGGAVCPNASGTGNVNETIATFPAASSLTYTISGTYSADMADY